MRRSRTFPRQLGLRPGQVAEHEFVHSCFANQSSVIPLSGFTAAQRSLANGRKPGALSLGFNRNFPLAWGHSSRSLCCKIPANPHGLIPSASGRLQTMRSEAAWSGFDEPKRRVT